jgi:hypothetical protein
VPSAGRFRICWNVATRKSDRSSSQTGSCTRTPNLARRAAPEPGSLSRLPSHQDRRRRSVLKSPGERTRPQPTSEHAARTSARRAPGPAQSTEPGGTICQISGPSALRSPMISDLDSGAACTWSSSGYYAGRPNRVPWMNIHSSGVVAIQKQKYRRESAVGPVHCSARRPSGGGDGLRTRSPERNCGKAERSQTVAERNPHDPHDHPRRRW